MTTHSLLLLPGDGIGPEVMAEVERVVAFFNKKGKVTFKTDTALCGGRIGTVCGLEFYGADHVLFASDAPFGAEGGASYIRETMKVIDSLDIAKADKEKICYRNAQSLFKL